MLHCKKGTVDALPVKLKKTKVTNKHFNFLVVLSEDGKTIFEKRTKKGIWQNLYQFPLVETKTELTAEDFRSHPKITFIF